MIDDLLYPFFGRTR